MIYEIVCNETGERYIGSCIDLKRRVSQHIQQYHCYSSKSIIDRGNYTTKILETIVDGSNIRIKEQEWLDKLENINIQNAYATEEHKLIMMRLYRIKYNNKNKEILRTKINCDCGGHYILCLKSRHLKTLIHTTWLQSSL